MRLRFRLFLFYFKSLFSEKSNNLLDEFVIKLRVLPNDVDIRFMTNDRYMSIMDLGRINSGFRLGMIPAMIKNKWLPVALNVYINFRYPLKIFQTYYLRSRIIWWDTKKVYFLQQFEKNGRVLISAIVCAALAGSKGLVSLDQVFSECRITIPLTKPPKSDFIESFQKVQAPHLIYKNNE